MKLIKSNTLFDGIAERNNLFIGFENDEITYVGINKPEEGAEVIAEGQDICVTPAFIDSHSHIGMARAGEPSQEEDYEQMIQFILLQCIE